MSGGRALEVFRLGRVEYQDGLDLQASFARARRAGTVGDVLLLLEHPPVVTLGRGLTRPTSSHRRSCSPAGG